MTRISKESKENVCPQCNRGLNPAWFYCPMCGRKVKGGEKDV